MLISALFITIVQHWLGTEILTVANRYKDTLNLGAQPNLLPLKPVYYLQAWGSVLAIAWGWALLFLFVIIPFHKPTHPASLFN